MSETKEDMKHKSVAVKKTDSYLKKDRNTFSNTAG